jgi:hypothetical protein
MSEREQGTSGAAYFHKLCKRELGLYNVVKDMRDRKVYGVDKPSAAIICVGGGMSTRNWKKESIKEDLYVWVALHDLLYPSQRKGRVTIVGSLLLCCIYLSLPERVKELVKGLS